MEYLIEAHRSSGVAHLRDIRSKLDTLKDEGIKKVDAMTDINSGDIGMFKLT